MKLNRPTRPSPVLWLPVLFILTALPGQAAPPLLVGVAASFAPALEEIAALYRQRTGTDVQAVVSSSGRLYAQVRNRAPLDIFFSADTRRPRLLFEDGYCERPRVYVRGRIVLWSRDPVLCDEKRGWQATLLQERIHRIGIPEPELAPYGLAAREALAAAGLEDRLRPRLVFASNVGQSFRYAATAATDVSFVSASLATTGPGSRGCTLPVPQARPVTQAACVVKHSGKKRLARDLLNFLRQDDSRAILARFGYSH